MALKDLVTDLSNFKHTNYGNAGSVQSQVSGRHGTVDAPIDNSDFDNGVGFGQDPNSSPQSFSVRGYQITGNKRFIVNYGGDIQDNDGSIFGLGEFNNLAGIGGIGTAYYSNLNPVSPRGSIYRDDSGNYRVPQEFGNTNPPGTESTIVGFNGVQTTLNIPQINLTGPFSDEYQSTLNTEPLIPNSHGSDFMVTPLSGTTSLPNSSLTHNVNMITLTGPTTQNYQSSLNTNPISVDAHGSDFFTTPLVNYTSQFSLDNLNTNINSGFDRSSMYISNIDEPNTPIFNQFTRGDSGLKRITLTSPNFNPFVFGTGLPYVIPQHTSTGPTQFTIGGFSDTPLIPDLHGSDFMTRPSYTSQIGTDTATHNVSMITLTGPTTDTYQTAINLDRVATGAHGSDFQTTPIEAFSSRFANQDGFLMNSVFDSGFGTDDFYVDSSNRGPTDSGTFKTFTKGETSLKTISLDSPNVDPDGNNFYTFPDRKPYNIPARDNTIFGFDQPFMLKDIGDKWGPNVDSTLDEGLVRGGIVTSVSRGIADGLRLSKFILTPKGILFAAKQAAFQLLNPRTETRVWNPLSLGSGNTTALGVPLRLERHLGGGTYLDAIGGSDGEDSILTGYGNAVSGIQLLAGGKIAFQTARRFTLAHLAGLVPGAGGQVSFGALPEISFDLLAGGSGNITSLSPNTFTDSNDIGFDVPDRNIYGRNNKYHINTGPSNLETLPMLGQGTDGNSLIRRVTGNDIGAPEDFTDTYPVLADIKAFTGIEDEPTIHGAGGLTGIARRNGGYSLTLGSSDAQNTIQGIPAGNLYDEGEETFPYQQKHNKGSVIPIGLFVGGYGEGPKYGLASRATKESIFDAYDGEGKAFEIEGEFGNVPESQLAVRQIGFFGGEMFDDPNSPYVGTTHLPSSNFLGAPDEPPKAFMIRSYQNSNSTFNPLISADERSAFQPGLASTIAYEPLSAEYPVQLSLRNRTGEFLGDTYSKDEPYADKPSIFIGDKSMLVMGSGDINTLQLASPLSDILENKISIEKKSAFTHAFANDRVTGGKDSVLPYNEDLFYGNYTSLDGGKYETNPERFQDGQQDSSLIKQLGVVGSVGVDRTTLFGGDTNNTGGRPQEQKVFTTSDADTNQYSKDKVYLGRIEVDGKSNFKSIFFNSDRLKGDPKVDFNTQYVDSDKFSRGGTAPAQGPFVKDGAKLQDFPRLNEENSGGNYGNEGQALGFLKGGSRKDTHESLIYGTDDGRQGFGTSKYGDVVKSTDDSSTKYEEKIVDGVPKDTKNLNYLHNVEGVEESEIGKTPVQASFPANENLPVGDINRYRTLAYGDLPSNDAKEDNKYSKRVLQSDKKEPVKPQLESEDTTIFRDKIGLVKISSDRGNLTDLFDNLNMVEYGNDFNGDHIKFKFYDTINKKYIIFPATLSGISDSVTPEWSSEKYIGRPDQVHVYSGTTRELSFGFKVGIMSKQQLLVCWEKLNYLIGLTYPTWKTVGNSARMEAPFMELTIGDMFNKTPGFINSLSYSVEDQTPWDIDEGTQLPKAIDVEVTFTHIGRHKLASQGKHYDLPWLRDLEAGSTEGVENSVYKLGTRYGAFNSGNIFSQNQSETPGGVSSS